MPSRATTIDSDFGNESGLRALLSRALGRNPIDAIGIVLLLIASGAILTNALYRQPGPHPAPIFSVKPRPVAIEPAEVVPPLPRTRPVAPVAAKADVPPVRQEAPAARPEPVARTSARPDPINDILSGVAPSKVAQAQAAAPSPRVMKAQSALNDFGYGPVKATGIMDAATTAAVQKFERARKLPPTGQLSAKVLRDLATETGRPME